MCTYGGAVKDTFPAEAASGIIVTCVCVCVLEHV